MDDPHKKSLSLSVSESPSLECVCVCMCVCVCGGRSGIIAWLVVVVGVTIVYWVGYWMWLGVRLRYSYHVHHHLVCSLSIHALFFFVRSFVRCRWLLVRCVYFSLVAHCMRMKMGYARCTRTSWFLYSNYRNREREREGECERKRERDWENEGRKRHALNKHTHTSAQLMNSNVRRVSFHCYRCRLATGDWRQIDTDRHKIVLNYHKFRPFECCQFTVFISNTK